VCLVREVKAENEDNIRDKVNYIRTKFIKKQAFQFAMAHKYDGSEDGSSKFYGLRAYLEHYITTKNRSIIFNKYKVTSINDDEYPFLTFGIKRTRIFNPNYNIMTFGYNPNSEHTRIEAYNIASTEDKKNAVYLLKKLNNSIFKDFFADNLGELERKLSSK
jgi:hypothetical protein